MKTNHRPPLLSISTFLKFSLCTAITSLAFATVSLRAADSSGSSFFLQDGDRVCFYGDSITEQRFYGADVAACVRTRFPNLRVNFVNSGVGGDRVTGGWAGDIDTRLERDVFPFKPNVVTIMLGMNDGRYRAFDQDIFNVYTNGYEHIIQSLQAHLPGVRIVLIEPSPFDDVTEPPKFPGGYNAVLLRYSAFVRQLADRHHLLCVDFNGPMVAVMQKAFAQDPKLSHEIIPGRVHPSAAGELLMAQALLQAWNVPATVTAVTLNGHNGKVARSENTVVSDFKADDDSPSWTQNDACLPFPILALHDDWPQFPPYSDTKSRMSFVWATPEPDWNYTNAATQMALDDGGFYHALDQQPLKVTGLAKGDYQLKINGQVVGEFSAKELHRGVNLAEYHTPMLEQSYRVQALVWKQILWRFSAWREIQLKLSDNHDPAVQQALNTLLTALQAQEQDIVQQQYAAAVPQTTHYELIPAGTVTK
jgi:lysophospholipase L1-like esterase